MKLDRRVAVLGAGGAGVCTALELARRGYRVDLYEREPCAVSQASFVAEGKIHLGFIYAKDRSLKTAGLMIKGALEFADRLSRWVDFDIEAARSTPFYYGIHRGSLMDPEALGAHYSRCSTLHDELSRQTGLDYLGLGLGSHARRLSEAEFPLELNGDFFEAVFETTEFGVDPRLLARDLRRALDREPRIELHVESPVIRVDQLDRGGFDVVYSDCGDERRERYSDVINATWHQRLPIDRPLGIRPPAPHSHRYKFGNRVLIPLHPDELPSCTCVQGPFGDIVNFRGNGLFLSWYPTGRTGMSSEEVPPDWHQAYSPEERLLVFEKSFHEWTRRCPALLKLPLEAATIDPNGGVIYALGTTDVDDGDSKLHDRFEIGIQSAGRYHSLDPGKFTLIPYWAVRMADRIDATG